MTLTETYASQELGFPILSLLIALPLAVAAILLVIDRERTLRAVAAGGALLELLLSLGLFARFVPGSPGIQLAERRPWIATLNVSYHVGVDGLSVLFIPLSALLVLLVMLASSGSVHRVKAYLIALLGLLSALIGIFCALDMILFFTFWELLLVPSYFLISAWGTGPERGRAALRYVMYMLVGSAPVLIAIIALAARGGGYTFDYLELLKAPMPPGREALVFFLLLFGFAVKGPVFPFHTWLPSVLVESPVGMGVILVGLKLGAYGVLRFVLPLAPSASASHLWVLSALAAGGIVYGALIALVQPNLRRMLAFSSVSHVGFVMVGLGSMTHQGLQGALLQTVSMGLVSTGLLFVAGFLYRRTGSSELASFGGIAGRAPVLTLFFMLLGLASIGLPGTLGFCGEHLILLGAFRADGRVAAVALVGVVLGAAYFLWYFERAFLGPVTRPAVAQMRDLRPRELAIVATLGALVLAMGLYPAPLLRITEGSIRALSERVSAPVAAPASAAASVTAPVSAPASAPVSAPASAPVSAPASVAAPVTAPAAAPASAPASG